MRVSLTNIQATQLDGHYSNTYVLNRSDDRVSALLVNDLAGDKAARKNCRGKEELLRFGYRRAMVNVQSASAAMVLIRPKEK